ncbi:pilus assembly protein TadG-related protein [Acidithiobacillus sp. IBUN Pt1247-S3]|uniref:pilus assembly protein TadG-related protein n=1 Tax=Acidithiobacillus sp. IBUN Pt1247-S3 TaxID=3166642 RepID=UPI0034E3B72F
MDCSKHVGCGNTIGACAISLENGQAALFSLLLLPAAVLGLLLIFNTGQATATKLKVQNAADAAAFSAMEMQARQMNLDAYLNRASIANEAAIGQAVSLLSWGRYAKSAADNIVLVLGYLKAIPYIGQAFAIAQQIIETEGKLADYSTQSYALAYLPLANASDAAFSGAQAAFNGALFLNGQGFAGPLVEQVVKLNDPQARLVSPAALSATYASARSNYVSGVGSGQMKRDSYARQASLIMESSDAFTRDRSTSLGSPLSRPSALSLAPFKWGTRKEGGSQLALVDPADADSGYVWSGMDTIHTFIQFRRYGLFGGWKTTFDRSWAYGGAFSKPDTNNFYYYQSESHNWSQAWVDPDHLGDQKQLSLRSMPVYQGNWSNDARGANQVVSEYSDKISTDVPLGPSSRGASSGIAPFRDLVDRQADNTDNAPSYLVVVEHPVSAVRDSVTALGISQAAPKRAEWTDLRLQTKGAHDAIRAAAKAQVYFRRPDSLWPRADGRDERANLYSPFWSARLVDMSPADRALVQGLP